jgi:dCMP deaminase
VHRISRPAMFMNMSEEVAKRGTCIRACVGSIITKDNRPVSMGYNGPPPGDDHCYGENCPLENGGCTRAVHAEINAMKYAIKEKVDLSLCVIYVTTAPCLTCSKVIAQSKIRRVFFRQNYRVEAGLDHLTTKHVEIYRVLPSGMVIDQMGAEVNVD